MAERILGVITARGGSKGLPGKHLRLLGGKPLIEWTIDAAKRARSLADIVVSSDDDDILALSRALGVETLKRPKELATEDATSESALLHALQFKTRDAAEYTHVALLQPTSPFRTGRHIDQAVSELSSQKADALISVCLGEPQWLKSFVRSGKLINPISSSNYLTMRRQDLPAVYKSNGAIYLIEIDTFIRTGQLWTENTIPFEMDDIASVDIDVEADLKIAERYLK